DVMNAQRKTVYSLRQQLLTGRYTPEELDELGKPTGRSRNLPINATIRDKCTPLVGQLLGMFSDPALPVKTVDGEVISPKREDFEKVEKILDHESLQREAYELWGVHFPVCERIRRTPVQFFDQLAELVGAGLTEQRERMLDLIDKIVSAMIEESCPPNRPPEDWDWAGIHSGFKDHFGKPLENDIDELGDPEKLVQIVFERAEGVYLEREK